MYVLVDANNAIKKFPYSITELRKDNPQTSFPEKITSDTLKGFNVFKVKEQPAPNYDDLTHDRNHGGIKFENGEWKENWVITEASAAEKAARLAAREVSLAVAAREQRNQLLVESDWTQLSDTPGQIKAAYVQYRQALRDLPTQPGFPGSINWPQKP